jgi:hypothetical protein
LTIKIENGSVLILSYPEWWRDWPEETTATGPAYGGMLVLIPAR